MNFFDYLFRANEKAVEDKKSSYREKKFYTVECIDGEDELKSLLDYIAKNGNGGHSFRIVVDPGDKERERSFFWDGDGPDRINAVVKTTTDNDKELVGILLTALNRIYMRTLKEASDGEEAAQESRLALSEIRDIAGCILNGADFDDELREALHEINFAYISEDDSAEKKLDRIKYIVEEALK